MPEKKSVYFLIFFLVIAISSYRYVDFFVLVPNTLISYFAYPVLRLQNMLMFPFTDFYYWRMTMKDLLALNEKLMKENRVLQEKNIALHSTLDFVNDTQDVRSYSYRYAPDNKQLVQLILKIFSDTSHFGYIDAGSFHGIKKDMVAVYRNCLVGKITEVYPLYSKILFISDASCKIAAYCSGTNAQGIHTGTNTQGLTKVDFVNHLSDVKVGDMVLSSGKGLVFPRGFSLGNIKKIKKRGVHNTLLLTPIINISKLDYCYVFEKGNYSQAEA